MKTRTSRIWLLLAVAYVLPVPPALVHLFCFSARPCLIVSECYLLPLPAARTPGADAHPVSAVTILLTCITNRCCCRYLPSALCYPPPTLPFFVLRAVWHLRLPRRPFSPGTPINTPLNVLLRILVRHQPIVAGRGCTQFVHGRSRMIVDSRTPTMPGWSTSGFHQPGRHCLHQARSAVRCSASRMKGDLNPSKNRS